MQKQTLIRGDKIYKYIRKYKNMIAKYTVKNDEKNDSGRMHTAHSTHTYINSSSNSNVWSRWWAKYQNHNHINCIPNHTTLMANTNVPSLAMAVQSADVPVSVPVSVSVSVSVCSSFSIVCHCLSLFVYLLLLLRL